MANITPALFAAFAFLGAPDSPRDDAVVSAASSGFAGMLRQLCEKLCTAIHGSFSLLS